MNKSCIFIIACNLFVGNLTEWKALDGAGIEEMGVVTKGCGYQGAWSLGGAVKLSRTGCLKA